MAKPNFTKGDKVYIQNYPTNQTFIMATVKAALYDHIGDTSWYHIEPLNIISQDMPQVFEMVDPINKLKTVFHEDYVVSEQGLPA